MQVMPWKLLSQSWHMKGWLEVWCKGTSHACHAELNAAVCRTHLAAAIGQARMCCNHKDSSGIRAFQYSQICRLLTHALT